MTKDKLAENDTLDVTRYRYSIKMLFVWKNEYRNSFRQNCIIENILVREFGMNDEGIIATEIRLFTDNGTDAAIVAAAAVIAVGRTHANCLHWNWKY